MTDQNKRWDGLTITRDLPVGVYFAGVRHKEFVLRAGVTGDLIAAQELHPEGPMQLITLEVFRRQILRLGDIEPQHLTTELLRAELLESDFSVIADADIELEKKLKPQSAASTPGAASSSTSSESVSG